MEMESKLDKLQRIRKELTTLLGHNGYCLGNLAIGLHWNNEGMLSDKMRDTYVRNPLAKLNKVNN